MMLGNKIYQSNRLGQILLDESSGYVVIADGFSTAAGQLEEMLKLVTRRNLPETDQACESRDYYSCRRLYPPATAER